MDRRQHDDDEAQPRGLREAPEAGIGSSGAMQLRGDESKGRG